MLSQPLVCYRPWEEACVDLEVMTECNQTAKVGSPGVPGLVFAGWRYGHLHCGEVPDQAHGRALRQDSHGRQFRHLPWGCGSGNLCGSDA